MGLKQTIRLKLLKVLGSRANIIGFDEPFKGLNKSEISTVLDYLNLVRENDKTIVVIDHTIDVQEFFEKKILLDVNDEGILREV